MQSLDFMSMYGPSMLEELCRDYLIGLRENQPRRNPFPEDWFTPKEYGKGDNVFRIGSPIPEIGIVLEGVVEVSRGGVTVGFSAPGDVVGEMEFLHARRKYMVAKIQKIRDFRSNPHYQSTSPEIIENMARTQCKSIWKAGRAVATGKPLCALGRQGGPWLRVLWLDYEFVKWITGHAEAKDLGPLPQEWDRGLNSSRRFEDSLLMGVFRKFAQNDFLRRYAALDNKGKRRLESRKSCWPAETSEKMSIKQRQLELLRSLMTEEDPHLQCPIFPDILELLENPDGTPKVHAINKIFSAPRRGNEGTEELE